MNEDYMGRPKMIEEAGTTHRWFCPAAGRPCRTDSSRRPNDERYIQAHVVVMFCSIISSSTRTVYALCQVKKEALSMTMNRTWTKDEDEAVLRLLRAGKSARVISAELFQTLSRSPRSISDRASCLSAQNGISRHKTYRTYAERDEIAKRYRSAGPQGKALLALELGISLAWLRTLVSDHTLSIAWRED